MSTEALLSGRVAARHMPQVPDLPLCALAFALLGIGLVMVASATLQTTTGADGLSDFLRQLVFAFVGIGVAVLLYTLPLDYLERLRYPALALALALLVAVFVPGLGHSINGSERWLGIGAFTVQASEPARVLILVYIAGYALAHREGLASSFWNLVKPIAVVAFAAVLLLAEPDFGGTIVLFVTVLGMLFFAGARKRDALILLLVFGGTALALALSSSYRLERLTTFLNPWAVRQGSGFQLTQALLAAGHGGVFGTGLGESVEKLLYLPEAQSDFIFSVLAEELGLFGVATVVVLYLALTLRALAIARRAAACGLGFAGNLAFGLGLLLGVQAFVNIGVNLGVLPTKGLTLPLMSAGGSSLIVDLAVCGLLLRVARETRIVRTRGALR
ncbi:MAG TPA: putative lipid II flippase FtsW [Gammaproteobacteria bacterium]|nr:putative lipid II flippase FtsW [Gammaproteobacteria bacterium]